MKHVSSYDTHCDLVFCFSGVGEIPQTGELHKYKPMKLQKLSLQLKKLFLNIFNWHCKEDHLRL